MRSLLVIACGLLGACQMAAEVPSVPWLHGLARATASEEASPSTGRRITDLADVEPGCDSDAYRAVELVADVARNPGRETVVASYAQGILVFDSEDRLVASIPGYPCEGTADAIDVLAAGDAYGEPTLVVVGSTGGRAERATWLGLFRVGADRLDPAFTANVEEHRGPRVTTGHVVLLPGALVYQRPGGGPQLYTWDPVARAYLVPGELLDDSDHDGPSAEPTTTTVSRR